jgi:hypothetical protein
MAREVTPSLVLGLPVIGRTEEKEVVSWCKVRVRVVPAWPMGKAMNSTRPQYLLRAASKGAYFEDFSSSFSTHPKSLQKPISMMMRVHCFLSKVFGSGSGESGTPLA